MKFRYLELFLAKIQFCPIFPWKSAFSGLPCLKTSLWRHTLADFQNFGINGKGSPSPIIWYHTLILWACQSQVHEGVVTTPLRKMCYGKYLRKTRVKSWDFFFFFFFLPYLAWNSAKMRKRNNFGQNSTLPMCSLWNSLSENVYFYVLLWIC